MHVQSNRTRTRVHLYCTHSNIVNWQNVILRHHANVHGGSSDLLAKSLDFFFTLVICTTQWLRVENSTHCGGEETGSKCLPSVYPKI